VFPNPAKTKTTMSKEAGSEALHISCVSSSLGTTYSITPNIRYAKKITPIDKLTQKEELMLQQMWQGQDGSQKWEWVEVFE
jgi:hypothetical protein